mmetsp:Transcript_5695/g.7004  ORF Transcript_5695/g.7004 Transcript_5695/m.7004 type:complete len:334 (+) Transcript_5695:68-1069(+)
MSMLQLTLRQLQYELPSVSASCERCHVVRQIGAMMKKEASVYKCNDYVLSHKLEKITMSRIKTSDPSQDFIVDDICRQKMCEWSYRIVDHFGGSRELVAISQNYVDRFLDRFRCDCTAYKLASITALYLAVKVHNRKPFSMTSLADLSRGEFLVEDIAEMENVLLKALDWNMCPPTASCFCGYFHALLPSNTKASVRQTILQRACFFSDLSVMDYSFVVSTNQSEIAFASILNSLAGLSSTLFGGDGKDDFIKDIEQCSGLDRKSERMKAAQDKLWSLYRRSSQYKVHDVKNASAKKRDIGHKLSKRNTVVPLNETTQRNKMTDSPVSICSPE